MKIAIVKLSALGDIIHSMIVLQYIKKNNPDIEVDWFVEEAFKGILEFNPDIRNVHTVNIKKAKRKKSVFLFLKELRQFSNFKQYDLVIDMQGLIKSAMLARFIPSKITMGFDSKSLKERYASFFYNKTFKCRYEDNIIERNLAIVANGINVDFLSKFIDEKKPFLFSRNNVLIEKLSNTLPNVVIIPGASYEAKCFPLEKIAGVINILQANFLIIWGNDVEKKKALKIKNLAPSVRILNKFPLDELISLIKQVDLVIGPDTGPTHMAWALNTPSITLFGPTPGYRNTRVTKINKILESKSIINPRKIDKNDNSIKEIKIADVANLASKLLN
jgi:heptosyltransferase I